MNNNKNAIRLNTITRDDMHVKKLLDTAPSTALYSYEEGNGQWTKDNVEGTLMVYEREAPPHNMMKIINKLNKINFIEPLTSTCEIQVKPPYLLFKNSKGSIYGIWFNDEEDVHRVSAVIKERITPEPKSNAPLLSNILNDPAITAARSSGGDIMSMLSHAHGEFESKRHEPTRMGTTTTSTCSEILKPSPLRVNGANSNNVVADFLAKVGGGSNNPPPPTCGRTLHSPSSGVPLNTGGAPLLNSAGVPSTATNPVLQKLFQGAAAIGGQASVSATGSTAPITIPGSNAPSHSGTYSNSMSGSAPMSLQELEGRLKEQLNVGTSRHDESHIHLKINPIGTKPSDGSSLLSPQVFTSSQPKELDSLGKNELFQPFSTTNFGIESKTLNGSDEPLQVEVSGIQAGITPLTQEQLVQAFTHMLKKDDFVRQLHEAYIQALHKSLRGVI